MHDDKKLELGIEVKDKVTGLRGVIIARVEYLYTKDEVLVQPKEINDGKPAPSVWFHADRVQVAEEKT